MSAAHSTAWEKQGIPFHIAKTFPDYPSITGEKLQHIVTEWRKQKKGTTRRTIDVAFTFPKPWSLFRFPAEIRPPEATGALRKEYESTIQDDYKKTVQDLCDSYPTLLHDGQSSPLDGLECHHIVPLYVGGTNEHLAYTARNTHERIHRFINAQIFGLRIGQRTEILIPYYPALIWSHCPQISIGTVEPRHKTKGPRKASKELNYPTGFGTLTIIP